MNAHTGHSGPDVSIVLIGYNDVQRLPRALASLQRQSHRNIEIIVVDDASTDGTAALITKAAAEDKRIHYVCLAENSGGCSAPRNRGIDEAVGTWVMFCDSDDEYANDAVIELLRSVEQYDADLGCGVAERYYLRESRGYPWRPELHEPRVMSSIMDFPELIADTISVNKIYRRTWLNTNSIRFPEGLLYEDQLFTMEAFTSARGIVVIPETTYRWQVQADAAQPSITQRRTEIRNVTNRVEINHRIDSYLAERGLTELQACKDKKFLTHDLPVSLAAILLMTDEDALPIASALADYVRGVDVGIVGGIPPINKVAVGALLSGDLEGIRHAIRYLRWTYVVDSPITVEGDRQYWGGPAELTEPAIAGKEARWWRDVTALKLQAQPFARQRLCHLLEDFEITGSQITLSGTTVDVFGMFDQVLGAQFVLMQGANSVIARLPMTWEQVAATKWRWRAIGVLDADGWDWARLGRRGVFGVELRTGTEVNIRTLHIDGASAPKAVIPWPRRPKGLRLGPSRRGTLEWRSAPSGGQRVIARLLGGGRG